MRFDLEPGDRVIMYRELTEEEENIVFDILTEPPSIISQNGVSAMRIKMYIFTVILP